MKRSVVWSIVPIVALLASFAGASPTSAQSTGSLGLWAYACETDPPRTPQDPFDVPSDCAVIEGATFTVIDASGEVAGGCTIASGEGHCAVELPMGATVTVIEDSTTLPAGYAPRQHPIAYTMPPPGSDGQFFVIFLNVPQPPASGPDEGASRLPTTGVGNAAGDDGGLPAMGTALLLLVTLGTALALHRRSVVCERRYIGAALVLLLAIGAWTAPAVRAQETTNGRHESSPVTGEAEGPIPASIGTTVGWRVVRDVAEPRGQAADEVRALGFGVPIDDRILTTNVDTGRVMEFAPGEVFYVIEDSTTRRESLTDDAVPYYRIALVPADETSDPGGDTLILAGEPFDLDGDPSRRWLHATSYTVGPTWRHVYGGTRTALLLVVAGTVEYGAADGQGGTLTAGEAATIEIPPQGGPDSNAIAVWSVGGDQAQIVVATID